jgi:hypothetical protein
MANPKLAGERETARVMLEKQPAKCPFPGSTVVADRGFAKEDFEEFLAGEDLHLTLIRPARKNDKTARPFRTGSVRASRPSSVR